MKKKETGLVSNNPNAAAMIFALQRMGYTNEAAICDIIDNSIDAGATEVRLIIDKDRKSKLFTISFIDNGCGMTKDVLDEALRLGSKTNHDENADLGKFGMGLCTAGMSLADITEVYTRSEQSDTIYKSVTDVDEIRKFDKFVKYLGEASDEEISYFNSKLKDSTGTIVSLKNCHGVKYSSLEPFKNNMINYVSQTYRKFMPKVSFYINDVKCAPKDVLLEGGVKLQLKESGGDSTTEYILPSSEIKYDDDLVLNLEDNKKASIHIKLALLPDNINTISAAAGINVTNQGIYYLRNNREIESGATLKGSRLKVKHPQLNRVRCEISFDSSLDEYFGVSFTKNKVDPSQSICDQIAREIDPQIKTMHDQIKKEKQANDDENISHKSAEVYINKKKNVLITPPVEKEKREHKENNTLSETDINSENEPSGRIRTPKVKQIGKSLVEFRKAQYGDMGIMFYPYMEGKTLVIEYNINHPFYSKFFLENINNGENVRDMIDFFVFCLASAQISITGSDSEKADMFEILMTQMSMNMRSLLK